MYCNCCSDCLLDIFHSAANWSQEHQIPISATNFGVAKFEAVGFEIFSSWPVQSMKQVPGQWR